MTRGEREKNDETNPISYNPQGINGLRLVSSTVGRPGSAKPDRSLHPDTRRHRPKARSTAERQQGDNELLNSEMTKQSQFVITPIDAVTCTTTSRRPEIQLYQFPVSLHFHHGLLDEATP